MREPYNWKTNQKWKEKRPKLTNSWIVNKLNSHKILMSYCPHFRRSFLLNEIHLLQFWQHWQNFYKPPHPLWLVYDSYNKTITEKKIDFLVLLSNNKKIILLLCWLAQKKKTAEGKKLIMQPSPTPSHEKRKKRPPPQKKVKRTTAHLPWSTHRPLRCCCCALIIYLHCWSGRDCGVMADSLHLCIALPHFPSCPD